MKNPRSITMNDGRAHQVGQRVLFHSRDGHGVGTIARIKVPAHGVIKFVLSHVVRSDETRDDGNWALATGGRFDALTHPDHGISGGCLVSVAK